MEPNCCKNKKIVKLFLLLLIAIIIFPPTPISAQEIFSTSAKEINVYFFWAHGCPHCSDEKLFLQKLEQKYSNVKIHSFEVTGSKENIDLLKRAGKELNVNVSGVPFTVIGEHYFVGWYNEQTTGVAIEEAIQCALQNSCSDIVGDLISPFDSILEQQTGGAVPEKIKLPFLGEIKIKEFSLPLLTILIAGLDGFNPCAMWVLLFLITLLLGMENKKRMWTLGSIFIASSAFVYFLFMSAWLNLFLFLGFVLWIRIIIGLVAISSGAYNLKEYFTNKAGVCKITGNEKRQKVFEKLKAITQKKQFWLAVFGIIILAFAVNLVELVCSAGLPAVYTQILTLASLSKLQYYLYLLLYVFVFMLDDLFIFFIAMTTLRITGASSKYSRFSHLIGGIIMLIIGILLIFKPEWLMFG